MVVCKKSLEKLENARQAYRMRWTKNTKQIYKNTAESVTLSLGHLVTPLETPLHGGRHRSATHRPKERTCTGFTLNIGLKAFTKPLQQNPPKRPQLRTAFLATEISSAHDNVVEAFLGHHTASVGCIAHDFITPRENQHISNTNLQ